MFKIFLEQIVFLNILSVYLIQNTSIEMHLEYYILQKAFKYLTSAFFLIALYEN